MRRQASIRLAWHKRSAKMRYDVEVSGMSFDIASTQILIDTNRFSQSRVSDKYLYYTANATPDTNLLTWKTASGRVRMTVGAEAETGVSPIAIYPPAPMAAMVESIIRNSVASVPLQERTVKIIINSNTPYMAGTPTT